MNIITDILKNQLSKFWLKLAPPSPRLRRGEENKGGPECSGPPQDSLVRAPYTAAITTAAS